MFNSPLSIKTFPWSDTLLWSYLSLSLHSQHFWKRRLNSLDPFSHVSFTPECPISWVSSQSLQWNFVTKINLDLPVTNLWTFSSSPLIWHFHNIWHSCPLAPGNTSLPGSWDHTPTLDWFSPFLTVRWSMCNSSKSPIEWALSWALFCPHSVHSPSWLYNDLPVTPKSIFLMQISFFEIQSSTKIFIWSYLWNLKFSMVKMELTFPPNLILLLCFLSC